MSIQWDVTWVEGVRVVGRCEHRALVLAKHIHIPMFARTWADGRTDFAQLQGPVHLEQLKRWLETGEDEP